MPSRMPGDVGSHSVVKGTQKWCLRPGLQCAQAFEAPKLEGWMKQTCCLTGQVPQELVRLRTRTDPPFAFVFDALDDDMDRMKRLRILEPMLTHAWHQLTWRCCKKPGAFVIDVGANYGWYSMFSLALGCSVLAFEPVPLFESIIHKGLHANQGFARRAKVLRNVVYSDPGQYTLRVPVPRLNSPYKKKLGMTGMNGSQGFLKGYPMNYLAYNVTASAARIDSIVAKLRRRAKLSEVCMLKVDVEGYEAAALRTAKDLLSSTPGVRAVQLEITRTGDKHHAADTIGMLEFLVRRGFTFRQVPNSLIDLNNSLPVQGSWRDAPGPWDTLPHFPSRMGVPMESAYRNDIRTFSTNLIAAMDGGF